MVEDNSVFKSISSLTAPEHISYLVVFLNFVLSNSNPAAILFYLITDLYKKGNVKDMRKWAYEIHSTFLVPTAVSFFFFLLFYYINIKNILILLFLSISQCTCHFSLKQKQWLKHLPVILMTN